MKNFIDPINVSRVIGEITQPSKYGGLPPIDEIIEIGDR